MKEADRNKQIQVENRIQRSTIITVICDTILIVALVLFLLSYVSVNNADTFNQNVENITNIATAKSELMLSVLERSSHEVKTAYRYCNGKEVDEIMKYLTCICGEESEYQLLQRDSTHSTDLYHVYSGFSTKEVDGKPQQIHYQNTDLSSSLYLHSSEDTGEICYSQGFTNKTDALRYFAVFCRIDAMVNGNPQTYFLVKPQMESSILDLLQTYTQYGRLATAVCYADGKYLAKDDTFRADNFYDYLYKYNDLSIDERNALREQVQNNSKRAGYLEFHDLKRQDCIFSYSACGETANWYVIVSVPTTEFVSGQLLSFFPLIIIVFLAVLLLFNIWRLLIIVKELRQSVERERIANSSKSSFLSRMSHEIRTPLNAVIGYNTIAQSEMNNAKDDVGRKQAATKVMDCLQKSEIASKHLLTIINDVLDMSAIESGKIKVAHELFDFKGLITSLTTVFYSQAKSKQVDFEVIFDNLTEEWFIGDQMRTNQILTNLLSNAIKFTPECGTVLLKIQQQKSESNKAHIYFDISDTGIGMSADYLERIWKPFEQADSSISRRFGGTGLGLSITKHLVELMNGEISVVSTPGVGTTFHVDLTFEQTEQPYPSNAYDFSSVNALVVDDDPGTCDYIRLLFHQWGAKCATVTSGVDAVKAVSIAMQNKEPFSIFLVDWHMPDIDGFETIRQIREISGDTMPAVILSAYDYSELAEKATTFGINKFVTKPFFQSTLFDLLTNIPAANSTNVIQKSAKTSFHGERILLAEDNNMNMEIATKILESAGLVVDTVWNGKEATKSFLTSPAGTYAAILMDIQMPELDGYEATRTIRASSHPEANTIPIIAMTADVFAEKVAEAHEAGMNDHIAKPIDIPKLFDTLKKYISPST